MIYFIEARKSQMVKIGYSFKSPEGRLATCQTGSPEKLTRLALMEGDLHDEQITHGMMGELWSHGEWFHDGPLLQDFLLAEAQPWDEEAFDRFVVDAIVRRQDRIDQAARERAERLAAQAIEDARWVYDRHFGQKVLKEPKNSFDLGDLRRQLLRLD